MGKSTFLRKMYFSPFLGPITTCFKPPGHPLILLGVQFGVRKCVPSEEKRASCAHLPAPLSYGDLCVQTIQMLILNVRTTGSAAGHVLCKDAHYIGWFKRAHLRMFARMYHLLIHVYTPPTPWGIPPHGPGSCSGH